MRIATFNVENLFDRARIMNRDNWAAGEIILNAFAELTALLEQPVYTPADKARIVALLDTLGLTAADMGEFVVLRRNRGALLTRRADGTVEITAGGRGDWIGWIELRFEPVNEIATMNTARVIRDVDADILAVVEAEDRIALREFSDIVLPRVQGTPYENIMLIDGNDTRGIDVGLLTKPGFDIGLMRSHVGEGGRGHEVFSRDCPEYAVTTPGGETIWVLVNHLKSKGFGKPAANNAKRRTQAEAVARYYRRLTADGAANIVVMGDLNDTPDSAPLAPLLAQTDLRDVSEHPNFNTGDFPGIGTFGLGNDNDKIDHLLLSPALFARLTGGGIFRKGAWPGARPKRWPTYPELQKKIHVASDHHALWADLN